MLSPRGTRNPAARPDKVQGLRLPDRDEIHCLQIRFQGSGKAYRVRQPRAWHKQDELRHIRRSRVRGDTPQMEQPFQEIRPQKGFGQMIVLWLKAC